MENFIYFISGVLFSATVRNSVLYLRKKERQKIRELRDEIEQENNYQTEIILNAIK